MSIGYFPDFLDDELFYSILARYNYDTGNTVYRNFARTFFDNQTVRADAEFINRLNSNALSIITKQKPLQAIIHKHTMFDYYTVFIPHERRKMAYKAVLQMDTKRYRELIPMPAKQTRYLRWCPACAAEDKQKYGFAYWHRTAQLQGINICSEHHCYLINSPLPLKSKISPTILSAEETVTETTPEFCNNSKEIVFAEYCAKCFDYSTYVESENSLPQFLQSQLVGTPYLSVRKKVRNITRLYDDLRVFCNGTNLPIFSCVSQLELIFKGTRFVPHEIALLGYFLGVPAFNMIQRHIPTGALENTVDDEIKHLHREGYNYREISKITGVGYDICKLIDYGRYEQ